MQKQKILSSQFGVTSGIRQDGSDFIVLPRPERGGRGSARRGKLWILTEPATPTGGASAAAKLVMESIEDEYYHSSAPTITGALEDAIGAANRLLYDYNSGAPAHKQAYLGVTCVVIHGKEAYFAQVQPARAIVVHQGTPRVFPEGAPRAEADLTPLGLDAQVEIELSRSPFLSGDTVSVLSAGLAQLTCRAEDEYGLAYQDHAGAVDFLHHLAARNNLLDEHAVVIEGPVSRGNARAGSGFQQLGREWLGTAGKRLRGSMATSSGHLRNSGRAAASSLPGRADFSLRGRLPGVNHRSFFVKPALPSRSGSSKRVRLASTLLGVLLLMLLAGGLGVRAYDGYKRSEAFDSLLTAAQRERQAARGKPAEAALQHLESARDYLQDAQKIDPTHAKIGTELRGIRQDWDIVSKVARMSALKPLAELEGLKEGTASKLVVVDGKALVLSKSTGEVHMYTLQGGKHSQLAPKKSTRFVGMSWRNGGAILLDRTGRVWDYDFSSGRWTSTKLGGTYRWNAVSAFDTYGSAVYVAFERRPGVVRYDLDSPGRARSLPSSKKGPKLFPSGLGADGDLWVANSTDNSLWKLVNGKVSRRLWVDAVPAIEDITGLVALDSNKYLYALDEERDRVLQVATNGQLQAQLTFPAGSDEAGRIDAIFADEKAKRLYLVSGDRLYRADLRVGSAKG